MEVGGYVIKKPEKKYKKVSCMSQKFKKNQLNYVLLHFTVSL